MEAGARGRKQFPDDNTLIFLFGKVNIMPSFIHRIT